VEAQTVISVRGLTKRFGDFIAVDQVSFEINRAEIFGFLGPNGSGKTTSIRMMLGILQPTDGEIELLGIDANKSAHEIRNRIGYMSQRFSLYNDLTVIQNLKFYGAAYSLSEKKLSLRIQETLEMAGLIGREDVKTHELSSGWRQRLALGVAILHQPEVIFLDEPTAGVDPVSRRAFWDLLYRLVKQNVTVFVTTHYMDEAEHCHRLAFILDGKIIAYGSPAEIKSQIFHSKILEILPENPHQLIAELEEAARSDSLPINSLELYGSLVHVVSDDPKISHRVGAYLKKARIPVKNMAMIEPSLEDVFIETIRKNERNRHNTSELGS